MQKVSQFVRKYPFSTLCLALIGVLSFTPFFPEHLVGAPAPLQKRNPQAEPAGIILVCPCGHDHPWWTGRIRSGLLHHHPFRRVARLLCRLRWRIVRQHPRPDHEPCVVQDSGVGTAYYCCFLPITTLGLPVTLALLPPPKTLPVILTPTTFSSVSDSSTSSVAGSSGTVT